MEKNQQLRDLLIMLLAKSGVAENVVVAVFQTLKGEEQRWQMALWLRRMMGKHLEHHLEFSEIWNQVEKIEAEIPED